MLRSPVIIFSSFLTERQMLSSGISLADDPEWLLNSSIFATINVSPAVFVCEADVWFCGAELRPCSICSKNVRLPVLIQKYTLYNALMQWVFLAWFIYKLLVYINSLLFEDGLTASKSILVFPLNGRTLLLSFASRQLNTRKFGQRSPLVV